MKDFFTNFDFKIDLDYVKLLFRYLEKNKINQDGFDIGFEKMMQCKKTELFGRPAVADWLSFCGIPSFKEQHVYNNTN